MQYKADNNAIFVLASLDEDNGAMIPIYGHQRKCEGGFYFEGEGKRQRRNDQDYDKQCNSMTQKYTTLCMLIHGTQATSFPMGIGLNHFELVIS